MSAERDKGSPSGFKVTSVVSGHLSFFSSFFLLSHFAILSCPNVSAHLVWSSAQSIIVCFVFLGDLTDTQISVSKLTLFYYT